VLGDLEPRICPSSLVKATQEVNTLITGVETAFAGSRDWSKEPLSPDTAVRILCIKFRLRIVKDPGTCLG
jgi:hypothetical protein